MCYINIAPDGRVLSACEYGCCAPPEGAVEVDALPEGDISEYIYSGGVYTHSPVEQESTPQLTDVEKLRIRIAANEDATTAIMDLVMGDLM